ncbi:Peroxisome size and maintenance regulator [Elasticomyces elasticus]|nr:Peroxisome size and maintenance regulator [Elasticomyces elasticus]
MDEPTSSAIVNPSDPVPVIAIPSARSDATTPTDTERQGGKRATLKGHANKLKGKLEDYGLQYASSSSSIPDRLLNTIMQQIVPSDIGEDGTEVEDERSRKYVDRPGFSLPLMSNNFRRFNARIGVVFIFQFRLIRIFSWRIPTHTLSFLALYTFLCLSPSLLGVVPLVFALFFVMVPAFLTRHPAPASDQPSSVEQYSIHGPPTALPGKSKPTPELSRDFFRNMRDLQNSMDDFSRLHDSVIKFVKPYVDFSDEALSSTIFLFLAALSCSAFIASHLMPWRAFFLIAGWIAILAGHPDVQSFLQSTQTQTHFHQTGSKIKIWLQNWIDDDIIPDATPEIREVEVFELQKHRPSTSISDNIINPTATAASGGSSSSREWEPWLFTPNPYDPLSPIRISGSRPRGTQFFEEVRPPQGWTWRDVKWTLDLLSREWVEERLITGVEVEMEGERWVYDLPLVPASAVGSPGKKAKGRRDVVRSWEEGTGLGGKGEWRRRRWVRLVERRAVQVSPSRTLF